MQTGFSVCSIFLILLVHIQAQRSWPAFLKELRPGDTISTTTSLNLNPDCQTGQGIPIDIGTIFTVSSYAGKQCNFEQLAMYSQALYSNELNSGFINAASLACNGLLSCSNIKVEALGTNGMPNTPTPNSKYVRQWPTKPFIRYRKRSTTPRPKKNFCYRRCKVENTSNWKLFASFLLGVVVTLVIIGLLYCYGPTIRRRRAIRYSAVVNEEDVPLQDVSSN